METEDEQILYSISEAKLKQLKIIISHKFNKYYSTNIYKFFELFKLRVLKQIIHENKYFNSYKKLYSLRNIFMNSLIKMNKKKLKLYIFYYWYAKVRKVQIIENKKLALNFYRETKKNYLNNIVLKLIIKNEKININIPIIKRYLLLYLKYYNYLTDDYYIKSITIVKAIFNYFRKKLKIYKAIFFSRIDYNIKNDDCIYIYKYIINNYINDNLNNINKNDNKKTEANLLLNNCNSIIKLDYKKNIKLLSKENFSFIIFDKIVINKFLINKYISKSFSIWKKNSLKQTFINNIQSKEILTNDLMNSKIIILVLIIKKKLKKYFIYLYYNANKNNKNKLLLVRKLESFYNNILFNILKGINKVQNFNNLKNSRLYNLNNDCKKIIALKKWKGERYILCNYNYTNFKLPKYYFEIIKGCHYFDSIYLSHDYIKISFLTKNIFKYFSHNINKTSIIFKIFLFSQILKNKIINIKKKIIIRFLFDIFKKEIAKRAFNNKISFFYSIIEKIFSFKKQLYINFFINKIKNNIFINLSDTCLNHKTKISEDSSKNVCNELRRRNYKTINKLQALNIYIKYYIKHHIKNNYLTSLKYSFIHWSSIIGIFPSSLYKRNEKDKNEEIQAHEKEILELKKCIKEDKDFQHDLKAKISVLDEENNFVNEKIYEITERVENCNKCNNLLKSSNINESKIVSNYDNLIKNTQEDNNMHKNSRNFSVDREGTFSSGFNFVSGGTDMTPKRPREFNKKKDYSEDDSLHIEDESINDGKNKNKIKLKEENDNDDIFKQKILELKRDKEPIINKLKEEIISLYKELNID